MPKHVFYTVSVGMEAGLTSASIGLFRALERLGIPVGFNKPFSQSHQTSKQDRSSAYIRATTQLDPPASMPYEKFRASLADGHLDEMLSQCIDTVETLGDEHEVVVVEGLLATHDLSHANEINSQLARSLNAEIVLVIRPNSRHSGEILSQCKAALDQLPDTLRRNDPVILLNRLPGDLHDNEIGSLLRTLNRELKCEFLGAVPEVPELRERRLSDLLTAINGKTLNAGDFEGRRVHKISLCARNVEHILPVLRTGTLVVTPSDRCDVILATALATLRGVRLAGLIFTSDGEPDDGVMRYCRNAFERDGGLPIIRVNASSFETARLLNELNTEVPIADVERINLVMDTIARRMDSKWLRKRCASSIEKRLSPIAFKHRISRLARKSPQRILLPEGEEIRTIEAAIDCARRHIARCILIGNPETINGLIRARAWDMPDYLEITDPEPHRERLLPLLMEKRKHRPITPEAAQDALQDNITLATLMVANGEGDGLVAGAIHSTADTIRPALRLIRTAKGARVVSSIFFMCLPDQVLVYGDCAVNPNPNAEQLASIAIQSAASAKAFGIEPRVAMISYSTLDSGSGDQVEKVREATALAKKAAPELLIDGPLQYDAATIPEIAAGKAPDSPVAGHANVLIFPDLNTGNTTYKAVQRSASVASLGPMLQGLRRPVNDLSRGATVEDITYTIALTAIQAQQAAE